MNKSYFILILFLNIFNYSYSQKHYEDFLTPEFYLSDQNSEFKTEVNRLLQFARQIPFQHPLTDALGKTPDYLTPGFGTFGAGKGPTRKEQHHPAVDFKVGNRNTKVNIYAAHDGFVRVYRDAPKYRHYISVTADVKDDSGKVLGKMVSIYGHVDLDLDSIQQILPAGKYIKKGELISKNLYSGTRGGPHLHFEIRYYRPADNGDEEFYGFKKTNGAFTKPSAGSWSYGVWNAEVGYGYGHPENHLNRN